MADNPTMPEFPLLPTYMNESFQSNIPDSTDIPDAPSLPMEEVEIDEAEAFPFFAPSFAEPSPSQDSSETPQTLPTPKRGRPKGSRNRGRSEVPLNPDFGIESMLKRKTDKELSERLQGILIGASNIPAPINPHIGMTTREAQAIADPLVSYAKNHVESERIQEFVEQWDLIAVGVASAAYAMRVVKDSRDDPNRTRSARNNIRQLPRPGMEQNSRNVTDNQPSGEQGHSNEFNFENVGPGVSASQPVIGEL